MTIEIRSAVVRLQQEGFVPNSGSAVFGLLYAPAKDGRVIIGVYVRKRRPKMEQTGCKCLCEKCAANKSDCPLRKLSEEGAVCNV